MAKNTITFNAYIQDGQVIYYDPKWQEKWAAFKAENEGRKIDAVFNIADTPEYFQHKYYRGYLLPDIAFAAGEKDVAKVHVALKRDFLFQKIDDIEDIPKKHFKDGIFIISQAGLIGLDGIPCRYIKGVILVENNYNSLIGYIPSTSTLRYKEMATFIELCENRLFVDLNGRLGEEGRDPKTAGQIRELAKNG